MGGGWRPHFWVWVVLGIRNKARNECLEETYLFAAAGASHIVVVPAPESRSGLTALQTLPQQHQHHLAFNTGVDISAVQPRLFAVQAAAGQPTARCGLAEVGEYSLCCQNYLRSNYARSVPYIGTSRGKYGVKEDYCVEFARMAAGLYCAVIWV